MKITIAITAASGAIYAKYLIKRLSLTNKVSKINLILSENAKAVIEYEIGGEWLNSLPENIKIYSNKDFFSPMASGSNCDDVMVVIPCSAGTLARVANGVSDTLITRSADVILKERKKLILVLRETPYNLIHIKNMEIATMAGAVILPATPSFYSKDITLERVILSVVERVEKMLGLDINHYKWEGK